MFLARDVRLAGLTLGMERAEVLLEPLLARFPRVDGAVGRLPFRAVTHRHFSGPGRAAPPAELNRRLRGHTREPSGPTTVNRREGPPPIGGLSVLKRLDAMESR